MGNRLSSSEDAQRFRDGYPGQEAEEDPEALDNLLFYKNELTSRSHDPTQGTIEEIHAKVPYVGLQVYIGRPYMLYTYTYAYAYAYAYALHLMQHRRAVPVLQSLVVVLASKPLY